MDHPRAVRLPRGERGQAQGRRNDASEPVAQGFLGDLLGHDERELQRARGSRFSGELGTWLVGEAGALLVRGRRVHCFCVRTTDPELPPSDRVAHLLLALREDEEGFATVANHAFAGAPGGSVAGCPSRCGRRRRTRESGVAGRLQRPGWRLFALVCGRDDREGNLAKGMAWTVVIAGGGFGGLYAARRLERRLPRQRRILLVADANMLYTPLLPGAAAGSLEPRHVVVPLREELSWTDIRLGRVTGADPELGELNIVTADGRAEAIRYDQLVVGLGSVRALPVPAWPSTAWASRAWRRPSPCATARCGTSRWRSRSPPGGAAAVADLRVRGRRYAGLEGIAELQDFVAVIDRYPRCRLEGTRWILVEAEDRVMQEIPASLAEFATQELRGRGMEIRTGTRLEAVEASSATLSTGERIPTRTVCWTTGVRPPAVVRELGLPLTDAGRIEVDETLRVRDRENVWAIGDAAGARSGEGRQAAEPADRPARDQQGRVVADNGGDAGRQAAADVPLPHARGVRGHGPAQGGGHDARAAATASWPGSPPAPTTWR